MCGIVAYTGKGSARDAVLDGLQRLEYRGYDSAGIGILTESGRIERARTVGGVATLAQALPANITDGAVAIGHTRWATHGAVSTANAHPFTGCDDSVLVALNGVVENHDELRQQLSAAGHAFESDTDAEVIAHLLEDAEAEHQHDEPDSVDLGELVAAVGRRLVGHFAFVVAHPNHPNMVAGHRNRCPLVLINGPESVCLASSPVAARSGLDTWATLHDGDTVVATASSVVVRDGGGDRVERAYKPLLHKERAEIAGHESFMRKEIEEQPGAAATTLVSALEDIPAVLEQPVAEILITGCGTSLNAALIGRTMIQQWANLRCSVEPAAEWPQTQPLPEETLLIALTQSGETADTIAAMQTASQQGVRTCVITNTADSMAARQADVVVHADSGLEVGVAATKTFVGQVSALAALALTLGTESMALSREAAERLMSQLKMIPNQILATLELEEEISRIAKRFADATHALYLGRGVNSAVALEGALKIKEIAYLPVEACSAGEMKHGPIALVEQDLPVVMVAPEGPWYEQTLTNMHEVCARGAMVVAVVTEGDERASRLAHEVIEVPACEPLLAPLLCTVPLQLLAYHAARHRGLDPDRPRNLAKTVTVQ